MKLNMYKEFESLILFLEEINPTLKKRFKHELTKEEFEDLKEGLKKFDYYFKTLNKAVKDVKKINIDEKGFFPVSQELHFIRTIIINMEMNFLKTYEIVNNVLEFYGKSFKKIK